MSVNNYVAQVAPMNHVAKVAMHEQDPAGLRQLAMQQVMQEALARELEKIEKPMPGEAGQKVREKDKKQGKNPEQQAGKKSGPEKDELAELFEDSEGEPLGNVWSGNIVNVKV